MDEYKAWHNDVIGEKAVEALKKNKFAATYCKTGATASERILDLIPAGAIVGIGGSLTLRQLGLLDKLSDRGHDLLIHWKPGLSPEEVMKIRRGQLTSDVFLTSTNAVTLDGKLVNTDGAGNRVAAMMFGPGKVVVVAGVNKIVKDVGEAEKRIKMLAAPMNNKRMKLPNPCTVTGECMDCNFEDRICNITTVISKKPLVTDIHCFIIGENLGF